MKLGSLRGPSLSWNLELSGLTVFMGTKTDLNTTKHNFWWVRQNVVSLYTVTGVMFLRSFCGQPAVKAFQWVKVVLLKAHAGEQLTSDTFPTFKNARLTLLSNTSRSNRWITQTIWWQGESETEPVKGGGILAGRLSDDYCQWTLQTELTELVARSLQTHKFFHLFDALPVWAVS